MKLWGCCKNRFWRQWFSHIAVKLLVRNVGLIPHKRICTVVFLFHYFMHLGIVFTKIVVCVRACVCSLTYFSYVITPCSLSRPDWQHTLYHRLPKYKLRFWTGWVNESEWKLLVTCLWTAAINSGLASGKNKTKWLNTTPWQVMRQFAPLLKHSVFCF